MLGITWNASQQPQSSNKAVFREAADLLTLLSTSRTQASIYARHVKAKRQMAEVLFPVTCRPVE